jgi:hypothetical protein
MAIYDNLPVYKQTYDLLLQLFRVCQNMERDYKFTLGENIKKEVIAFIINVYRANCRENADKLLMIQSGRENVEVIRLLLRLLQDLKQIGLKEFISANEKLESVSKQMTAWANSISKPTFAKETKKKFEGQSLGELFAFQECAGSIQ